jgi:RNA polymerase sigma factor (sigma-70 family)
MNPTAEELYEKYEYIATKTLYHMFNSPRNLAKKHNIELEDLVQYAKTAVFIAAKKYNPEKNCKFSSYAISYVHWHVQERLSRECCIFKINPNKHDWNNMYSVVSIDDKGDETHSFHDLIPSETDVEENVMGNMGEELILNRLNDKQKEIIRLKEKGMSFRDIGKCMNCTGENVRYHYGIIQKKLENYSEVI